MKKKEPLVFLFGDGKKTGKKKGAQFFFSTENGQTFQPFRWQFNFS
jgi:hypothetical protein